MRLRRRQGTVRSIRKKRELRKKKFKRGKNPGLSNKGGGERGPYPGKERRRGEGRGNRAKKSLHTPGGKEKKKIF